MNKYTLDGCAFLWKVGSNLSNKLLYGNDLDHVLSG